MQQRSRVGLAHQGPERRRENARRAMEAVGEEIAARLVAPVLIKMGFNPADVGALQYAGEQNLRVTDERRIDVLGPPVDSLVRVFLPHEKAPRQRQWRAEGVAG
jgi:hypothetical protein